MYEVSSRTHFSAAHHLRNYNGACENVHGHNWDVEVFVRCIKLDEIGIGIDFKVLKKSMNSVLDKLDHMDLNLIFTESVGNPSSENIARYIFEELEKTINNEDRFVCRVDVYETPGNRASYFRDA